MISIYMYIYIIWVIFKTVLNFNLIVFNNLQTILVKIIVLLFIHEVIVSSNSWFKHFVHLIKCWYLAIAYFRISVNSSIHYQPSNHKFTICHAFSFRVTGRFNKWKKGGGILSLTLACHHYLSVYRWSFYNIYEMKLAINKKKKLKNWKKNLQQYW